MIEIAIFRNGWVSRIHDKGFLANPFPIVIISMEYRLSIPKWVLEFYIEKYPDKSEKKSYHEIL